MAFVVKDYGNGSLGDVDSVSSTINSYARVTAVNSDTITINTSTQISGTATFKVGAKILLHVSATTSSSYKQYLGCYLLANVTAVSSNVLTLDADPTTCIPSANLSQYYVQAIAVAQYKNLTLNSGTAITPPVYSATNYVGGIVALMCSETLTFGGGHINLTDKGIPVANKTLRPTTQQEDGGTNDTDTYSGWENSDTKDHLLLNAGDGAAFIVAKSMICNTSSRIGNTATRGYQFYRGTTNSVTYNETAPTDVTNVGGSTILIAAQTITNFTPYMFAKYRSSSSTAGQGICRCYIASETKLRNDEGLYAYDCISDKGRMKRMLGIKNYGNGSFGDLNNVTTQLNNYAKVTAINGNKVTYTDATTNGLAPITAGAMVMIHWNHKDSTTVADAGRFFIANVLTDNGTVSTLDATPPNISTSSYACQIISIPQAKNFTLGVSNTATPAFNGTQGGICAIAVKDSCTLSDGIINVHKKGGSIAYERAGLAVIGNAQDCNKLPIGQGNGSVFLIAHHLVMNNSTRIGDDGDGNNMHSLIGYHAKGGVRSSTGNYSLLQGNSTMHGSGAYGGLTNATDGRTAGGYGSNGTSTYNLPIAAQGAHIMIIANKVTSFKMSAISSGGIGRLNGGAGYGGSGYWLGNYNQGTYTDYGGGYNGGGGGPALSGTAKNPVMYGGSSGWVFVYCNEVVDQDTTGTVLDN